MIAIPGIVGDVADENGFIYSQRSGALRLLKVTMHRGYLHVRIIDGQKIRKMPVHRLVLSAFAGAKPTDFHMCRHLDGNPLNNRSSNLSWGTAQENADDAKRHGTHISLRLGQKHPRAKLSDADVLRIRSDYAAGIKPSAIGRSYRVDPAYVARIGRGYDRTGHTPSKV